MKPFSYILRDVDLQPLDSAWWGSVPKLLTGTLSRVQGLHFNVYNFFELARIFKTFQPYANFTFKLLLATLQSWITLVESSLRLRYLLEMDPCFAIIFFKLVLSHLKVTAHSFIDKAFRCKIMAKYGSIFSRKTALKDFKQKRLKTRRR